MVGPLTLPLTVASLTGRPEALAPLLLGCELHVTDAGTATGVDPVMARIVEVEAYGGVGEDPASHAHRRMTPGNAVMFGEPGLLHVFFTYGMHWCANVVVHQPGESGAVLLRAAEVLSGYDQVRERRGAHVPDRELARGPARLTKALGITGSDDGVSLLSSGSRIRLVPGRAPGAVAVGPRVGVNGPAAVTPWRWWDTSSRQVSAYRPGAVRRARSRPEP